MTLYTIFVSNESMETYDQRGISETTVGEMRKQHIAKEGEPEPFWYSLDDSTILVNAPSEESFHQLLVFHWGNPPYDIKFFTKKPFVYGAEGIWNEKFIEDLFHYIKLHVNPVHQVELLRFWADGIEKPLKKRRMNVATLELKDIIALKDMHDTRIIFE